MEAPTTREIVEEMLALSGILDADLSTLHANEVEYAQADNAYRAAKAKAYLAASGTIPERDAKVDEKCGDERLAQRMADAKRYAAREAVRTRRAQLSAWQSIANAAKAEAELVRTAPRETS